MLSALGLLVSNLKAEFTRTCLQTAGAVDAWRRWRACSPRWMPRRVAWLDAEAVPAAAAASPGMPACATSIRASNCRAWAGTAVTEASIAGTIAAFHRLHERLYTFAQEDTPVEIVTLRVDAEGAFPPPVPARAAARRRSEAAITGEISLPLSAGPVRAAVYDRARLGAGDRIEGPAMLTQLDATTLLLPGQTAEVHALGALIVRDQIQQPGRGAGLSDLADLLQSPGPTGIPSCIRFAALFHCGSPATMTGCAGSTGVVARRSSQNRVTSA